MWFAFNANATTNASIENSDIDQLLHDADETKTSGAEQFKLKLRHLESLNTSANTRQKQYLSYLKVYEHALDGDFITAKKQYIQLFEQATDPYIKIRIKATLANIQAISREYASALVDLDYAINNVNSLDDEKLKNKINLISSLVYFSLEIYDMSLQYAEAVVRSKPESMMLCKSMVYAIRSHIRLNNTVEHDSVNEAIELCDVNNEDLYAIILELDWLNLQLNQALLTQDKTSINDILRQTKEINQDVDQFGYNNLIGLKDMVLAKAYYYAGQVELALNAAQRSIDGSAQSGNTSQVVEALKILVDHAVVNSQFKTAYELSTRINKVENEIYNQTKAKQMAYMSAKHNNLAKQIEIQQLKQNNQLLTLENKLSSETTKKQQLMMLLILSVLVFLVFWTLKIKRRHDYFKEVAEIDHLTQVFTRKAFEDRMRNLIRSCAAEHQPLNLAIMDLDHFKKVNDQHGHLVGDWVLKNVILTCEEVADHDIMIARLGGEEFAVVSPGLSHSDMMQLMEKMRIAVADMDCHKSGVELNITASFGISTSDLSGMNTSLLLTHADLALFEAKKSGRNQVLSYASILAKQPVTKIS